MDSLGFELLVFRPKSLFVKPPTMLNHRPCAGWLGSVAGDVSAFARKSGVQEERQHLEIRRGGVPCHVPIFATYTP